LWLPFYYDEIVYITNKILSFKGISNVSYDHYAYHALKDVVATHSLLRHVSRELGLTVRGLAENFSLCSHIKIYNPPTNINKLLKIPQFNSESEIDLFIENIRTRLRTWFEDSDADELEKIFDYYARVQNNRISHNLDSAYDEYMDHNVSYPMLIRNDDLDYSNNISFSRAQFIVGVSHILRPYLDDFIREPNALRLKVIYNKLKSTSHNVSIVFQYIDQGLNILFTGDVGKQRLNQIIKNYEVEADII
jgi:hypothetical protein